MSAQTQAVPLFAVMDLGTSYADCLRTMNAAAMRGVNFNIDARLHDVVSLKPKSLELLLGMAQDFNRQECRERCTHNRKEGVKYGRPEIELPDNFFTEVQRWKAGEISSRQAAQNCGLSPSTFLHRAKKAGLNDTDKDNAGNGVSIHG